MGLFEKDKTVEELRTELMDDTFAMAIGAGIPAALMEIPAIESMSDAEVIEEAKSRGLI